jgi:hypothetical protein
MGNFQDGYLAEALFGTLHYLPEHGNRGQFSLHHIFRLPLKEKSHTNEQQIKYDEIHM